LSHFYVFQHAGASEGQLAIVLHGGIGHLLNARDQRGERAYQNAAPLRGRPAQSHVHHAFRWGGAGLIGIGGVRHQRHDAAPPNSSKFGKVGGLPSTGV
jgi:hypothetical protein